MPLCFTSLSAFFPVLYSQLQVLVMHVNSIIGKLSKFQIKLYFVVKDAKQIGDVTFA